MKRRKILQIVQTIWHTKLEQLLWRVRYTMQRKASRFKWLRDLRKKRLMRRPVSGPVGDRGMFTCRLVRSTGDPEWSDHQVSIRFLEQKRVFSSDIDWHVRDFSFGRHSWLFNLHYLEWLQGADDRWFERVVGSWMDNNSVDAQHHWSYAWHSYVISVRIVFLIQQIASRWESVEMAFRERLLQSLYLQTRYLARHIEYDLVGNHLLKNIKALLWSGAFFAGDEAHEWSRKARRLLRRELEAQFLRDGAHYERSPAYHLQVLADLLECRQVTDKGALRRLLDDHIDCALSFAVDMHHPDGSPSLFNDGMLQVPISLDQCRRMWRDLSGSSLPAAKSVFSYFQAGYFGARKDRDLVIADCGSMSPDFLPAHAHADILSFEWTLDGHRIVVDPGTFSYDAGERRNLDRSTPGHNTVSVGGASQTEFWGSHRMGRRVHPRVLHFREVEDAFVLEGEHGGFRYMSGKPVHRRRFDAAPHQLEVEDRVAGGDGQQVEASVLFHPRCSVTPVSSGYEIVYPGGCARLIFEGESTIEDARWSPDFGVEMPCKRVVLAYGGAPCTGSFKLEKL